LFKPIIDKLVSSGVSLFVYVPEAIQLVVATDIGNVGKIQFLSLDKVRKANRWRWYLHRAAQDLLTRSDFSFQFQKRREQTTKRLPFARRVLSQIAKVTPKVPNQSINRVLGSLSSIGYRNPFKTDVILVGSVNSCPELLGGKDQRVVTVMESWDHAVKEPNGYSSDCVFVWNDSLAEDWQRVHGDKSVKSFYPLKLRYARNWTRRPNSTIEGSIARPFCVYAVAGTRRFSIPILVRIERQLILDLVKATEVLGWDLLIKPRPNGEQGEFNEFTEKFTNVRVGTILDQEIDTPPNYFLTEAYNQQRFSEIEGCEFVINAFTTFGLDAAAAGFPVLQLDLQDADRYSETRLIFQNFHIQKYLINRQSVLKVQGDFIDSFCAFAKGPRAEAQIYSKEIYDWLFSGQSEREAMDKFVRHIESYLGKPDDQISIISHGQKITEDKELQPW
jgi:hypothetical protein